ncbi:hypothetical protein PoB_000158500 [Plakobranchus ocellatus]|uniref:Uncharacterized protein n=1 Tax=Plakobranchus ocellatus TaxID=259542 RepID=A0AAV3XW96_9GAST|nr:hypothetical protein PoB_000158500 [Plakobranchus ocellatus]
MYVNVGTPFIWYMSSETGHHLSGVFPARVDTIYLVYVQQDWTVRPTPLYLHGMVCLVINVKEASRDGEGDNCGTETVTTATIGVQTSERGQVSSSRTEQRPWSSSYSPRSSMYRVAHFPPYSTAFEF